MSGVCTCGLPVGSCAAPPEPQRVLPEAAVRYLDGLRAKP